MQQIYDIYYQFIGYFPDNLRWVVSFGLGLLVIYAVYKILKRNFIFLILLIVLLPASVPIVKDIWGGVVEFIKFLLTKR